MKTLRRGDRDPDDDGPVGRWQYFLHGLSEPSLLVDGDFGIVTDAATKRFQSMHALKPDGIVASQTYGKAAQKGFRLVEDDPDDFPAKPAFRPMPEAERIRVFGKIPYQAAPTADNPERITIERAWTGQNIVSVKPDVLTQSILCHRLAAPAFLAFFRAVREAGLDREILSFNGGWSPRFKRGSRTRLSNHAWGTAIDLNAPQNRRGTIPAWPDEKGTVFKIVPIAHAHGIYWGGHFPTEDGMHFELAQV
jgi:hypothetical protein